MKNRSSLTVAVVLICYKQSKYIREALDGLRLQTRTPDEVVIADDGSPDDTAELIKAYVLEYKLENQWTLLLSKYNRGINENFQNAIDHTNSEIIIPMSGDDISLCNRTEIVEKIFIYNPTIFHIVTASYIIDENGKINGNISHKNEIYSDPLVAIKNGLPPTSSCGIAFRREIISTFGKLPTDIPNEDGQLLFRGIIYGGLLASSEITTKYRIHDKSASSWMREFLTNDDYFLRYIKDLDGWSKNMFHWSIALNKSNIKDKNILICLANKKIDFYKKLQLVHSLGIIQRLKIFFEYKSILCKREIFYIIFGKFGFISWRKLRAFFGRI
jgi:glycosyltransferase involved in cell wall biosynthesis